MKRFSALVLAVVLAVSLSFGALAGGIYGDLNNDNRVNSSDALRVLMFSTGLTSLNSNQKTYADVNGNGKINSSDALLILQYSVGLIKVFPVESGELPDVDHEFFG